MLIFDRIKKLIERILSPPSSSKTEKAPDFVSLERFCENPIIEPRSENDWEAWQTFNPGVVLIGGKVHFLYRAMGNDGASRLGYANSGDGFHVDERLPYPVYRHREGEGVYNFYSTASGGGWGGAEDPRMVRVGDEDKLYVTYTAFGGGIRVALTSIDVNDFLNKRWRWAKPTYLSPPGEVNKNWMIFPEKIGGKYAVLHSINPEVQVDYLDKLELGGSEYIDSEWGGLEREDSWDHFVRGAGAPPIKTKDGWLLFYHAMSKDQDEYKVGAKLLDLEDPTKILHRTEAPVLAPNKHYENQGHKSGVVYVSGAIVRDGQLMVYYGGADSYVCVATAPLDDFLEAIKHGAAPKTQKSRLRD